MIRPAAFALFWPLLAAWTWLLVRPNPIPDVVDAIGLDWRFLAAKCLHGGTYAALAGLGRVWPAGPRGRWLVLGLLLLHGVGTEVAQTFVPNRSGCVRDVLVDWAGVAVGWTVMRSLARNRRLSSPVIPTGGGD